MLSRREELQFPLFARLFLNIHLLSAYHVKVERKSRFFFPKAHNWCDSGTGVECEGVDLIAGGRWPLRPNYLAFWSFGSHAFSLSVYFSCWLEYSLEYISGFKGNSWFVLQENTYEGKQGGTGLTQSCDLWDGERVRRQSSNTDVPLRAWDSVLERGLGWSAAFFCHICRSNGWIK